MLKIITPPDELITVEEVASFLRLDSYSAEQSMLETIITAARQACEEYLGRRIGPQTLELRLAGWPAKGIIELPPPIISVDSVKYLDSDCEEQTVDAADYTVSDSEPASIVPVSEWPEAYDCQDSVRVRFQAGYDDGISPATFREIPKTVRLAMLMQIADMYANREAQVERALVENLTVQRLLSTYRLGIGI